MLHLIHRAGQYTGRIAIATPEGRYAYEALLAASARVAGQLLNGKTDLQEAPVAFMVRPGFEYVATQWGIWRAGGIAVPLCVSHPLPALRYVVQDARAGALVADPEFEHLLRPLAEEVGIPFYPSGTAQAHTGKLPEVASSRRAMILYTSGTTGKPKGVVTTHAALEAQISTLVQAWEWQPTDHILNILPLHHVHGIVNVLSCALWSGACCEFLPKFDAEAVLEVFRRGAVNVFMAVPTIYYKLIAAWEALPAGEQAAVSASLRRFRLMVSGSAALPVSVLEKWRHISGHTLLERYGMTEMGMAVSNPYRGQRRPGYIGQPLPGVQLRLVDEKGQEIRQEGVAGEIQVKGPNVFREYWQKPEATREAFTPDGWFRTGDIATLEAGSYRILGRNSVDIIKSGGYKISALEIEEVLRTHPHIKDCGVVGIADEEWGELVAASLVPAADTPPIDLPGLTAWLKERLPAYKVPRKYLILDDLPRNAMGKVTKNQLKSMFS